MSTSPEEAPTSARALLGQRDYRFYWACRWFVTLATQVQAVTLAWHVYAVARETRSVPESAFLVGLLGLATFVPIFLLTLTAGETVDRYNRKRMMLAAIGVEMLSILVLTVTAWTHTITIPLMLGMAALFGVGRAFHQPAGNALAPMLVPRSLLPRAIAWSGLAWQTASVAGPAAGGLLVALSPAHAYSAALVLYVLSALAVLQIRRDTTPEFQPGSRWELIKEGVAYVWRNKVVFGAITLDLVAVLLGGATALLPVFARDILHVGPEGFGLLRAGPAIGATVVGVILAARPPHRHAGILILGGVAAFGFTTVVFGLSREMWLSVTALALLGGADMLSVYVRHTLIQLNTPDIMRGRVSAVSAVFIGASNELGEFETGLVARLMGPVGAALFGGVGAMMATALWAKLFPALRKTDRMV